MRNNTGKTTPANGRKVTDSLPDFRQLVGDVLKI